MKDFDKELAKIDRLLEKQGINVGKTPANAGASATPEVAERGGHAVRRAPPAALAMGSAGAAGAWLRAGLGVVLAAAVWWWPYGSACGWPLAGYAGVLGAVVATGLWGAIHAWSRRAAAPHIVSVTVIMVGLGGLGLILLPRFGYAGQAAQWLCR